MRQILWRRSSSRRSGLKASAICVFLMITMSAGVLRAQPEGAAAAAGAAPPTASTPAAPDPWTSPGGVVPAEVDRNGARHPYGGGLIQVDLKADAPGVRLDHVQPSGNTVPVCFAPCTRLVPSHDLYVIQGEGIRSTSRFVMPDDRNQVTLSVQAGSSARAGGGAALILGGIVVGYLGVFAAQIGLTSAAFAEDGSSTRGARSVAAVGGVLALGGLVAMVSGIYMALTSKTVVNSSTGSTFSEGETLRPRPRSSLALTPAGLTF
jgi:hypothetical protein